MSLIELKNLAHSYLATPSRESDYALRRTNHLWQDGKAYALLGPSGCGKTTLLNIISGLLQPSEGQVLFDGVDVTALPPEKRNIAQVFQFPVIYDTMTVFDNLAFPLRNRGIAAKEVRKRVQEVAEMLELEDVLYKRAANLAADAKQKISLGRGLVRSDVAAVLFDEPLTVIDPHLKWLLRRKLKQIHTQFKLTMIYVTHDQLEALTFADRVVVMHAGQVVQIDSPQELFENPQHTFVGYFIGSPGMNIVPCTLDETGVLIEGHKIPLALPLLKAARTCRGSLEMGIRPAFLKFAAKGESDGLPVELRGVEDLGTHRIVTVSSKNHIFKVKLNEDIPLPPAPLHLFFPPDWTRLYADSRLVTGGTDE